MSGDPLPAPREGQQADGRGGLWYRGVATGAAVYLAGVVVLAGLLRCGLDWWPLTLMRFGPRWVVGVPLAVLAPWALAVRPRPCPWVLAALAVAAAVAVGPVMGFNVPCRRLVPTAASGTRSTRPDLLVMTLNVEHAEVRHRARLAALLARTRPDIVALQEFSGPTDDLFPPADGWSVRTGGGLGLAARFPVESFEIFDVDDPDRRRVGLRCDVRTPWGVVALASVHLTTPRDGLEAVLGSGLAGVPSLQASDALRRRVSSSVRGWLDRADDPLLIAGDFNQPGDDPTFRRVWSDDYQDAFEAAGTGFGPTRLIRWYGVRIDHVLAGPGWRFRRCWVGPDVGSDHRPVFAEVDRLPPADTPGR